METFLERRMEMTIQRSDMSAISLMLKLVTRGKDRAFAQLDQQPGAQVYEDADVMELRFEKTSELGYPKSACYFSWL